jgi:hypothetical protein
MQLTEEHIKKIHCIAEPFGWVCRRVLRNHLYLNYERGGFYSKIAVSRTKEGDYTTETTHNLSFVGDSEEFNSFLFDCNMRSNFAYSTSQAVLSYLANEVGSCNTLSPEQTKHLSHLVWDFGGWIVKPIHVDGSLYGLTVKDKVLETLFSGDYDQLDLALTGGRIEVDTQPNDTAVVWYDQDYLYPLAKSMSDYLVSQGFECKTSNEEISFLG